ncbi:MAG: hypothetical protein ACE5OO_00395 [Candidatus Bathyarchaeia archaeon]
MVDWAKVKADLEKLVDYYKFCDVLVSVGFITDEERKQLQNDITHAARSKLGLPPP